MGKYGPSASNYIIGVQLLLIVFAGYKSSMVRTIFFAGHVPKRLDGAAEFPMKQEDPKKPRENGIWCDTRSIVTEYCTYFIPKIMCGNQIMVVRKSDCDPDNEC